MDNRKFLIIEGAYDAQTPIGYIVGEDNAKKYCAQVNYKLAQKENMKIDPDDFEYTDLMDDCHCLHCKEIKEMQAQCEEKYNFQKRYNIIFRKHAEEVEYELRDESDCKFDYYIGGKLPPKLVKHNEYVADVHVNADNKESALTLAKEFLDMKLHPENPKESESGKINLDDYLKNDHLMKFIDKIADANSDLTMEQLIEALANASWREIEHVEYEDSEAKIYRTYDLNSVVDCIEFSDLSDSDEEDIMEENQPQFVVYTNSYGDKSIYLANSPAETKTVHYCDIVIDTVDGIKFSPLAVMQARNNVLEDDLKDGEIWTQDIAELFGLKMVALHPKVKA